MNCSHTKNFYLLKRDRLDSYDELLGLIESGSQKEVEIWEPLNKFKNYHLVIIHGTPLPETFCFNKKIWKTDENIFVDYYKEKISRFKVHYFNEFNKQTSGMKDQLAA